MALPHWTVDYLKRGLDGVTEQIGRPEALQRIRDSAADLLGELPDTAARRLDRVLGQARSTVIQARDWAKHRATVQAPAINALGVLIDPAVAGQPQTDAAIAAAIEHTSSFSAQHVEASERLHRRLRRGISAAGCSLPGGTEVAVANGLEAALVAVAAWARSQSRPLIVPRCAAISLTDGVALPEVLAATGATLREVGPNDHMTAEDWNRARIDENAIILLAGDADPEQLPAARTSTAVVRLLTLGTLGDSPEPISPAVPSAAQSVQNDRVDVVILPADGLVNGPRCGLIIGRQQDVSAIIGTACWSAVAAAPMTRMMLAASLTADAREKSPVETLLATSVENLQHRAERLLTRIGGAETAVHGEVSDEPASIARNQPYRLPSRQLRLRRDDLSAEQWAAELAGRVPAVLAEAVEETLVVDLRWVHPREDAALADALLGVRTNSASQDIGDDSAPLG